MAFITTILATLIGGILAIASSVVVKRWELRQAARIRMFDELLPEVASEYFRWLEEHRDILTAEVSKDVIDSATRLYRAARLSGDSETDIVRPIRQLMRKRSEASDLEQAHNIDGQVSHQSGELESFLEKKVH